MISSLRVSIFALRVFEIDRRFCRRKCWVEKISQLDYGDVCSKRSSAAGTSVVPYIDLCVFRQQVSLQLSVCLLQRVIQGAEVVVGKQEKLHRFY